MFTTQSTTSTVSSVATILVGTAFLAIAAIGIASPAEAKAPAGFQHAVKVSVGTEGITTYRTDRRQLLASETTARPNG